MTTAKSTIIPNEKKKRHERTIAVIIKEHNENTISILQRASSFLLVQEF